jgi:hypothetical protein
LQSLSHKNFLFLTDKKFESCDDEILLKDLYPKIPRALADEEQEELKKTIDYSYNKLFDAFNIAKSIWTMAYDSVQVSIKKNKENIKLGTGFAIHFDKEKNEYVVWEFFLKKQKKNPEKKLVLNEIYKGALENENFIPTLENTSKWKNIELLKKLPILDVKFVQNFPMEQTLIPLIKRKILTHIYQSQSKQLKI